MYAARHVLPPAGGTASFAAAPADDGDAQVQPNALPRPDSEAAWLADICRGGDVELVFRSSSNGSNGRSMPPAAGAEAEHHSAAGTAVAPQQRYASPEGRQASTSSSSASTQPQHAQQQASFASSWPTQQCGRLRVHGAILSLCSHVLAGMLEDLKGAAGSVLELAVDDPEEGWRALLPLLYPRMTTTRLNWPTVRLVAPLAHKYDIPLVLRACEAFLAAEDTAPLSAQAGEPHYVLDWLEIAERLHMDPLHERCIRFIRYAPASRPMGYCDYCGERGGRYTHTSTSSTSTTATSSSEGRDSSMSSRHAPYPTAQPPQPSPYGSPGCCCCKCVMCGERRRGCYCGVVTHLPLEDPHASITGPSLSGGGLLSPIRQATPGRRYPHPQPNLAGPAAGVNAAGAEPAAGAAGGPNPHPRGLPHYHVYRHFRDAVPPVGREQHVGGAGPQRRLLGPSRQPLGLGGGAGEQAPGGNGADGVGGYRAQAAGRGGPIIQIGVRAGVSVQIGVRTSAGGALSGDGGGGGGVVALSSRSTARDVVLRDREGLGRLTVRSLVDLLALD